MWYVYMNIQMLKADSLNRVSTAVKRLPDHGNSYQENIKLGWRAYSADI